jgi:hypothetical protein
MTLYDWTPDRIFHFATGIVTGVLLVTTWRLLTFERKD